VWRRTRRKALIAALATNERFVESTWDAIVVVC